MLDLSEIKNEIEEQLDEDQAMSKLINIQQELHSYSNPTAMIQFYDQDTIFHELFGQGGDVLENLDKYIDASNEGLMQDYLAYGLIGLANRAELSDLARIRKICKQFSNSNVPDVGERRSIYLPPYTTFVQLMKKMDAIFEGFMKFAKSPDTSLDVILTPLKQAGVKVSSDGSIDDLTKIDWKAIAGSILSRVAGIGLVAATGAIIGGPAGAVIGGAAAAATSQASGHHGAHMFSKNGGPIQQRGWNAGRLAEAAKKIVELIDRINTIKRTPPVKINDPELAKKLRFVKNAFNAYTKVLKDVGRGVATAFKTDGKFTGTLNEL